MGRYLIIGAAGLAATGAIWMFGFNAANTLPAGVSHETTASIAAPQAPPPHAGVPQAGPPQAGLARPASTESSDGHTLSGVWVPSVQRAR